MDRSEVAQILGVDDDIMELASCVHEEISDEIATVNSICRINTARVLEALAKAGLSDYHFGGTTGYGYDDIGRDCLEEAFAHVFGAESALVRIQIVSGTHALAAVIFGVLRPGDLLVSAFGTPYDTMVTMIGRDRPVRGSLAEYGIDYLEVQPAADGGPDFEQIASASRGARMVMVQRSPGYSWRKSLGIDEIGRIARCVKEANPKAIVFVDNCYGEFVETREPTAVGADVAAGRRRIAWVRLGKSHCRSGQQPLADVDIPAEGGRLSAADEGGDPQGRRVERGGCGERYPDVLIIPPPENSARPHCPDWPLRWCSAG